MTDYVRLTYAVPVSLAESAILPWPVSEATPFGDYLVASGLIAPDADLSGMVMIEPAGEGEPPETASPDHVTGIICDDPQASRDALGVIARARQ